MDTPTDEPPRRSSPLWLALRVAAVTLVGALLALLVWRVVNVGRGGRLVAEVREHKKPVAPNVDLKVLWRHPETWSRDARASLADGRVSLLELRGIPVVLNFWASWCVPCGREAPRLNAAATAHHGTVLFLGIDVKDFSSDARTFLRKHHVNYVSVRDGGGRFYNDYGLTGLPETYFLDRNGRIVAHKIGEIRQGELESGVNQALESST